MNQTNEVYMRNQDINPVSFSLLPFKKGDFTMKFSISFNSMSMYQTLPFRSVRYVELSHR